MVPAQVDYEDPDALLHVVTKDFLDIWLRELLEGGGRHEQVGVHGESGHDAAVFGPVFGHGDLSRPHQEIRDFALEFTNRFGLTDHPAQQGRIPRDRHGHAGRRPGQERSST